MIRFPGLAWESLFDTEKNNLQLNGCTFHPDKKIKLNLY